MINGFTEGDDFLDSYLKDKEYIYVSTITHEYCDMAYNWFLSLKNINQEHLSLIIALDKKGYNKLLNYNVPCVYLNSGIESNNTMSEWIENEKSFKVYGVCYILAKYKINLIYSDVDVFFLKNPIQKLKKEVKNFDFVVMSDKRYDPFLASRKKDNLILLNPDKTSISDYGKSIQSQIGIQNAGFSYLEASNLDSLNRVLKCYGVFYKNSDYFEKFPKKCEIGNLQSLAIQRYKEVGLKVKILNCFEFPNGSLWKIPYLKNKIKSDCYLVHYNFEDDNTPIVMRDVKINEMKKNYHWLL